MIRLISCLVYKLPQWGLSFSFVKTKLINATVDTEGLYQFLFTN